MPYSDLSAALARAKERSGARASDDAYLTEILNISAGVDPQEVTQFRPYFVAAKFLEQNRSAQTLAKAKGGVEFTGLAKPIASLMALQASIDQALDLAIPAGFEAIAQSVSLPRQGTRSLSTQARP